jgi:hypothetical protein
MGPALEMVVMMAVEGPMMTREEARTAALMETALATQRAATTTPAASERFPMKMPTMVPPTTL